MMNLQGRDRPALRAPDKDRPPGQPGPGPREAVAGAVLRAPLRRDRPERQPDFVGWRSRSDSAFAVERGGRGGRSIVCSDRRPALLHVRIEREANVWPLVPRTTATKRCSWELRREIYRRDGPEALRERSARHRSRGTPWLQPWGLGDAFGGGRTLQVRLTLESDRKPETLVHQLAKLIEVQSVRLERGGS
jgi:hypothetical protein